MSNIYICNINIEHKNYKNNVNIICYSIEEALHNSKIFMNDFYELYKEQYNDNLSLYDFYTNENTFYECTIDIVSGNRIRFNTSKELMDYFNTNIKNISNDNLYDFLLSLVVSETLYFDYKGNLQSSEINKQLPVNENVLIARVYFTEEDCKNGKYIFEYR